MEENAEVNLEVIAEIKKRRTRIGTAVLVAVLALVGLFVLKIAGPDGLLGISEVFVDCLIFVVVIAISIFASANWRCPVCNSYLGRGTSPKFCQSCGVRLKE